MNGKTKKIIGSILFFVVFVALWQFLYVLATQWFHWMKPYAVPNPWGVVQTVGRLIAKNTLFSAIYNSMRRMVIGFVIALLIGIVLGILIINFKYLARNLRPVIMGVQTLPSICWVPFAILWFGLGESAIIFVVVMGSTFSIALAIEDGIKNVPPIYIKAAKTMGLSRRKLYMRVVFPAALPSFVSGIKQSWSFAWRALMSGEVMSASVGLGYTLTLGRDLADINQVMTVMLVIVLIGIIIDKGVFTNIENHMLRKRGLI